MVRRTAAIAVLVMVLAVLLCGTAGAAMLAAPASLNAVIGNIRTWLVGLLVALATLLLTIGGVRYLLAGGDPGEVQRAKNTLKYAAIGYGVAALAPLLVSPVLAPMMAGRALHRLRQAHGISRETAAYAIHASQSTIDRMELGRTNCGCAAGDLLRITTGVRGGILPACRDVRGSTTRSTRCWRNWPRPACTSTGDMPVS